MGVSPFLYYKINYDEEISSIPFLLPSYDDVFMS